MIRIKIIVVCAIAFTSIVAGDPVCEGYSSAQCETFVDMGVVMAYANGIGKVEDFIEPLKEQFKKAIATVSNDYVILEVRPEHVLIVDVNSSGDRVVIHFLVVNPSGSTVLPVAFRSHELYLMCEINDDKIDEMLDYSIEPIEPETRYTLAIPPWAIAISCYVGLICVCYIVYTIYQAKRQFKNMEDRIIDDYEMQSSMEKGHGLRLHVEANDNGTPDPADVPNEKGTQVRQHQIRTETSVEVTVESPCSSKLGENDEIPPPYTFDNSSSGSSTGDQTAAETARATHSASGDGGKTAAETAATADSASADDAKTAAETAATADSASADDAKTAAETAVVTDSASADLPDPPPPLSSEPAYETIMPSDESFPPPPSPEEMNDTDGLTQGEKEATAALDGVVNDGFQDEDNLENTSL